MSYLIHKLLFHFHHRFLTAPCSLQVPLVPSPSSIRSAIPAVLSLSRSAGRPASIEDSFSFPVTVARAASERGSCVSSNIDVNTGKYLHRQCPAQRPGPSKVSVSIPLDDQSLPLRYRYSAVESTWNITVQAGLL